LGGGKILPKNEHLLKNNLAKSSEAKGKGGKRTKNQKCQGAVYSLHNLFLTTYSKISYAETTRFFLIVRKKGFVL
jgi:hypothetical protein